MLASPSKVSRKISDFPRLLFFLESSMQIRLRRCRLGFPERPSLQSNAWLSAQGCLVLHIRVRLALRKLRTHSLCSTFNFERRPYDRGRCMIPLLLYDKALNLQQTPRLNGLPLRDPEWDMVVIRAVTLSEHALLTSTLLEGWSALGSDILHLLWCQARDVKAMLRRWRVRNASSYGLIMHDWP